ncbi:MAG TPA: flagellar biosynthesis anti-sigma factor FlgM [Gammaproteobacteria bacterium]|nr:flagellar biosynthesis anti-sigma factor FlgM [Gammaproteobacteria bacterium]
MEIENSRIASLVTPASGQGAPVESQEKERSNSSSVDSGNTGNSSDRVSLTGEARRLKELETRLASTPVVDSQRVKAVRSAIENGTFTINPERIAEKLVSLEVALSDAR